MRHTHTLHTFRCTWLTASPSRAPGTVAAKYHNDAKERGYALSTAGIGDVYTDMQKGAKVAFTAIQFNDTQIDEKLDNVHKLELISIPVRAACYMADVHALYPVAHPHVFVCRFSVSFGCSSR